MSPVACCLNYLPFASARKDAVLPLDSPVVATDGTCVDQITIRKGQNVIVAFGSVNRLPSMWGEDAYEWKPERWLTPLPAKVHEARIPSIYSNLCAPHSC